MSTVHLQVFAKWGCFAACGTSAIGLGCLTEDAKRVTCADCLSRLVTEER